MQKRVAINKRRLSALYVEKVRPQARTFLVWDSDQKGLALQVQPSGFRAFKLIYRHQGRSRWFNIGDAKAIGLADARLKAAELMLAVTRDGKDPAGEKRQGHASTTFGTVASRYVAEHAQKRNKSWRQADTLIRRYVLPMLGELDATTITRADVRAMLGKINGPVLANQVLASASAIFTWAGKQEILTHNPCRGVERHATASRERVLSDAEVPLFWQAFRNAGLPGTTLQVLLLTGQRPGEVAHMRWEHIADGWWTLPGVPDAKWPGTKNAQTHRVWLPEPVRKILPALGNEETGYVFGTPPELTGAMRSICKELSVPRATPHDLRRTHGTTITGLGFGRDAMNRVQNHKEGGIASVYDRHQYAEENKRVIEAVASRLMALAEGATTIGNVVTFAALR
jgi:integrase